MVNFGKKLKGKILYRAKNPIFMCAFFLAIFLYSGIFVPREKNIFKCVLPAKKIAFLKGKIVSNPTFSYAFGGTYWADFLVDFSATNDGKKSQSKGNVRIFIPKEFVESIYPGKIFSASGFSIKDNEFFLAEQGAILEICVKNKNSFNEKTFHPIFYVNEIKNISWEKGFFGKIAKFRAICRISFRRLLAFWGNAGGFLLALLEGSRDALNNDFKEGFRRAGISHVIALSGMHLSIFSGLALFIGNKTLSKKIADFLRLFAICFFVWFAGFSPSLFRAFLCALLVFLSTILRLKKPDMLNVLSLSFLIHTVIFPEHCTNAAFLLSYGALLGILLFSQTIKRLFSRIFFPNLSDAFSQSVSAQAFTIPICAKIFGTISTAGIPASILITPLVTLFIYAGLAGILLSICVPFLRLPLRFLITAIYSLIEKILSIFKFWPVFRL